MAVWPFNHKKKQNEALPEEVQEYYEAGRKQQTGMAWLLALGTLVVTVILALTLFFGGRWIYNRFSDKDQPAAPTAQKDADVSSDDLSSPTPSDNPASSNATNPQQGTSSTNTQQSSGSTSQTPSTGSSATEVPDTGPGPDGLQ